MSRTWVVVADSAMARVFVVPGTGDPMREVEAFAHPEARLAVRELTSDLPGSVSGGHGSQHHALQSRVEPKQQEAIAFARFVADRIESARTGHEFDRLVLVPLMVVDSVYTSGIVVEQVNEAFARDGSWSPTSGTCRGSGHAPSTTTSWPSTSLPGSSRYATGTPPRRSGSCSSTTGSRCPRSAGGRRATTRAACCTRPCATACRVDSRW